MWTSSIYATFATLSPSQSTPADRIPTPKNAKGKNTIPNPSSSPSETAFPLLANFLFLSNHRLRSRCSVPDCFSPISLWLKRSLSSESGPKVKVNWEWMPSTRSRETYVWVDQNWVESLFECFNLTHARPHAAR